MEYELNLGWFEKLPLDQKDGLIKNIEVRASRDLFSDREVRLAADVCLPILRAIRQGHGITAESLDLVQLAESRGFRRSEIEPIIRKAWHLFQTPIPTKRAARYIGKSPRQARRLVARMARRNDDVIKTAKGWLVPLAALDSYLTGEWRP
ncbi:hypothetical protein KKH39_00510 [Patescibacteria group bacterium]|nr:hypothetical protein [Patescibacteria group bacterium]